MASRHNHSAAVGSLHKFSEKEETMKAGRRFPILALGMALGMLAREAMADDAAGQTVLEAVIKQAKKAEHSRTRVRSEPVDGQSADLYSVEAKTASGGTDSQIWISSASGLPLRQHTLMLEQASAKAQHDVRFDYIDVRAPQSISH
jgi:hypothetical protein